MLDVFVASTRVSSVWSCIAPWSVRGIQGGGHLKVPSEQLWCQEVVFGKGCFWGVPGWCSLGMVVPCVEAVRVNSTFLEFSDVAGSA